MPKAGLTATDVVATGAQLCDEVGFANLTMGRLAQRLGVRTPSLYKHVNGLPDLQHAIAVQSLGELGDTVRDALQGRAGADALAAFARAFRSYVNAHPGRYTATIGAVVTGPDDPLERAGARIIDSLSAVLRGYDIGEDEMVHALRTLRCTFHGFATLQASNAFQWTADADESFEWMIRFIDHGLRTGKP